MAIDKSWEKIFKDYELTIISLFVSIYIVILIISSVVLGFLGYFSVILKKSFNKDIILVRIMFKLSKKKIQRIFDIHSLGTVKSVKILEEGLSNPTYMINNKIVLRIKKDSNEFKFEKERFLFDLLRKKTNLPVPKVIDLDSSKKIIPYDYTLLEKLPGKLLKDVFSKLSKPQKKKMAYNLGVSLAKIHSIHFKKIGNFRPDKITKNVTWSKFIWGIYTDVMKKIKRNNLMDKNLIKKVERFIKENKNLLNAKFKPSLLHNDFNGGNILVQKGKISGIFDMEWSFSGHSEYELSAICCYL